MADASVPSRASLLLVAVPLTTGCALVAHVVINVALVPGVLGVFLVALLLAAITWSRLSDDARARTRRRALIGVAIGLVSTLVYDGTRLALVAAVGFGFNPLETVRVFGRLLVGSTAPPLAVAVAGSAYHLANGIGFATAMILFIRRPGVRHGLAWALLLEAAMVSIYPGWLDIRAIDEFISVSVIGHIAYGLSLGVLARRFVPREPAPA